MNEASETLDDTIRRAGSVTCSLAHLLRGTALSHVDPCLIVGREAGYKAGYEAYWVACTTYYNLPVAR